MKCQARSGWRGLHLSPSPHLTSSTCVMILLAILSSASASVLPTLLVPESPAQSSSAYEYKYDPLDQESSQDYQELSDQTTGREVLCQYLSNLPLLDLPVSSPVCRYCSVCSCREPSLQDGLRFSEWIRRYLYTPIAVRKEVKKKHSKRRNIRRRKYKLRKLKLE